jgi:hypothetical protein
METSNVSPKSSVAPRLDIDREFGIVSPMPPVRAGGQTAIAAKAGDASPQYQ